MKNKMREETWHNSSPPPLREQCGRQSVTLNSKVPNIIRKLFLTSQKKFENLKARTENNIIGHNTIIIYRY